MQKEKEETFVVKVLTGGNIVLPLSIQEKYNLKDKTPLKISQSGKQVHLQMMTVLLLAVVVVFL